MAPASHAGSRRGHDARPACTRARPVEVVVLRLCVAAALLLAAVASPWLDAETTGERPAVHARDACPNPGHNHAYCAVLGSIPALPGPVVALSAPAVATSVVLQRLGRAPLSRADHLQPNPRAPPIG